MPTKGEVVKSHFAWGIVTASCLASLCGTYLAVELLHRRGTGVRSTRSWFETVTCAICLGLVGIWCMHFIGNRAIILGDGSDNLQLVYNPGLSVASAFLPMLLLTLAFALQERQYSTRTRRGIALLVTGLASGLSVFGMHYVGNLGISNYSLHYRPGFMAGSFIVAIADCLFVMGLFYTWRDKWISQWPRRLMCAALLSIGISTMHFLASTKCVYRFKHYSKPSAVRSRNVQVIVAGALCGVAAFAVGLVLLTSRLRDRRSKQRSKKVMLGAALFHQDRLLVTTGGTLPVQLISNKYHHKSFREEFDANHPVFHWIFRVSRNWSCISDFIPKMKSHIHALRSDGRDDADPNSAASSVQFAAETYRDYCFIFRERFCVAASNLAATMGLPVTHIGVLFDKIIDIGVLGYIGPGQYDGEAADEIFGTGKLLLLTRQILDEEVHNFINLGFRFATVEQVGRNIASRLQVTLPALSDHVTDLRRYTDYQIADICQKPGTCIGVFAMVSNIRYFDLAVMNSHRDQIPVRQIMPGRPSDSQTQLLKGMHRKTLPECNRFISDVIANATSEYTAMDQTFARDVRRAVVAVSSYVPDLWVQRAIFYGEPLNAHFSDTLGLAAPVTLLYSFVVIPEVHASFEGYNYITLAPLKLYRARQNCYPGSPNNAVLAYEVREEFGKILDDNTGNNEDSDKKFFICKKLSEYLQKLKKITKKDGSHHSTASTTAGDNSDDSIEMSEIVDPMDLIMQSSRVYGPQERQSVDDHILVNQSVTQKHTNVSQTSMEVGPAPKSSMEITPNPKKVVNDGSADPINPVYDGNEGTTTGAVATGAGAKPVAETTFVEQLSAFAKSITTQWTRDWN